jgi:signal transduction histidine kinase
VRFRAQLVVAFLVVLVVALASVSLTTLLLTEAHSDEMSDVLVSAQDSREHFLSIARRSLLLGVLLGAVLAVVLAFLLARRLAAPLRETAAAAEKIAHGEYGRRVPVRSDDEFGQLAVRFNEMAASLADLEDLRRELIVTVAHELGTPLTSIQGYLQGMREGVFARDERQLALIEQEAQRLGRLVEDLRQLSRAESGAEALELVETDLRGLVEDTVDRLRPQLTDRQLRLRVGGDSVVSAPVDRRRVRQVLINVLDNAIRYTPAGGRIEVDVLQAGEAASIVVSDTGVGIGAEHLPRVFERFYRAEPSRGRTDRADERAR